MYLASWHRCVSPHWLLPSPPYLPLREKRRRLWATSPSATSQSRPSPRVSFTPFPRRPFSCRRRGWSICSLKNMLEGFSGPKCSIGFCWEIEISMLETKNLKFLIVGISCVSSQTYWKIYCQFFLYIYIFFFYQQRESCILSGSDSKHVWRRGRKCCWAQDWRRFCIFFNFYFILLYRLLYLYWSGSLIFSVN